MVRHVALATTTGRISYFPCVSNGCDLYPYTNEFRSIDSKLHSNMFHMKCCQLTHTRAQSFLLEVGHRSALPWARAQGASFVVWSSVSEKRMKLKICVQLARTVLLSRHNLCPSKQQGGSGGTKLFPGLMPEIFSYPPTTLWSQLTEHIYVSTCSPHELHVTGHARSVKK